MLFKDILECKKVGGEVGFTASTFDLLHVGHIAMLNECRAHCDMLLVGLLVDPTTSRPSTKMKPIESILERYIKLEQTGLTDFIIPFETEEDLEQMLLLLNPDIRFVGEEYMGKEFTGSGIKGIEIFYNSRKHNFSSTKLKNKIRR